MPLKSKPLREEIGDLCADTPTLTVWDGRGLTVREVAYQRAPKAKVITALITRHQYDVAGRLISSIDPRFGIAKTGSNLLAAYSLSGRALRSESVDAGWQARWYGAAGQVLQTLDARGTYTRTEYDCLLRPLAIHEKMQDDKEQCVERFTYGTHGDTANNRQGRLIRHDDPAGTHEIKSYSLTGAVQHEVRSLLPAMLLSDWPKDEEERDNRLERQYKGKKAQYYETHWTYNALGELLSQKDAQNNEQYFKYNIAGQLQAASVKLCGSETKQPVVKEVIYNASGQALQEENGNRVVTKYTYEPETQRLSSLCTSRLIPSGRLQELQTLQYYYDPVGNILRINDRIPCTKFFANKIVRATSTYRYDALYQLVQATGREHARAQRGRKPSSSIAPILPSTYVNYVRTYEYDAGGNLTTIQGGTGASRFKMAQGSNRLAQVVSNLQAKKSLSKLDYDAHGNPTTLSSGQTLTWDARNQLCRVTPVSRLDAPDDEESYQYESSGQRIRKTTHTLVDRETHAMRCAEVIYLPGLEIRRRYSSSGTLSEELHVICAGTAGRAQVRIQHWAQPKRQIEDAPPQDQFRYSLSNHLGSSVLELNQAAEILSYEEYYPFGGTAIWSTKSEVEADYKVMRYSGKERDATGLYYYGFRYYAPWLGRWLNPDPAGTVDGLNLYRMVGNNPISFKDADGRMRENIYQPGKVTSVPGSAKRMLEPISTTLQEIGHDKSVPKPPKAPLLAETKKQITHGFLDRLCLMKAKYLNRPPNFQSFISSKDKVETILVHGTFNATAAENGWTRRDGPVAQHIIENFGGTVTAFQWSGKNHRQARISAGEELAKRINNNSKRGMQTNIIAHSHGGNVAFEALKISTGRVSQLITLGTPIREDHLLSRAAIENKTDIYVHVFGGGDSIARKGGFDFVTPWKGFCKKFGITRVTLNNDLADSQLHITDSDHSQLHSAAVLKLFHSNWAIRL